MLCIKSAQQWSSFVLEEERGATFYSILHVIVRCVFIYYRPANQFKGTFLRNVQEVWALIAKSREEVEHLKTIVEEGITSWTGTGSFIIISSLAILIRLSGRFSYHRLLCCLTHPQTILLRVETRD